MFAVIKALLAMWRRAENAVAVGCLFGCAADPLFAQDDLRQNIGCEGFRSVLCSASGRKIPPGAFIGLWHPHMTPLEPQRTVSSLAAAYLRCHALRARSRESGAQRVAAHFCRGLVRGVAHILLGDGRRDRAASHFRSCRARWTLLRL